MDSGQTIAVIVMLLSGGLIAIGVIAAKRATVRTVAPLVHEAQQAVNDWQQAGVDRYNNLPELGKIRVDKRYALMAKYGGTVGMGVLQAVVFSAAGVTGAWIIPLALGSRWVKRNWEEQSDAIAEADARREQILHPTSSVGSTAGSVQPVGTRNYWDPN